MTPHFPQFERMREEAETRWRHQGLGRGPAAVDVYMRHPHPSLRRLEEPVPRKWFAGVKGEHLS